MISPAEQQAWAAYTVARQQRAEALALVDFDCADDIFDAYLQASAAAQAAFDGWLALVEPMWKGAA